MRAPASPAPPPSLATSLVTPTGTWAVVVMGGSAASHNNFWQLFTRPYRDSPWQLVTPPGVASNGGLVLAAPGTGPVVAGFRPSQDLAYSPLAITHDNGATWTPAILDAGLADVPGALAAAPSGGRLLALLTNGTIKLSTPGATAWTTLATHRTLAASTAASRCRPGNLTATAFSPSGAPLLAADCTRPGTAGIFAYTDQTWHLAAPTLPAPTHRKNVTVLRLTTTTGITTALLAHGHRVGGTPARRLVHRQRRPLVAVAAITAGRRESHLRLVRPQRHGRDNSDRQPGENRRPPRPLLLAATAHLAGRHSHPRPRH